MEHVDLLSPTPRRPSSLVWSTLPESEKENQPPPRQAPIAPPPSFRMPYNYLGTFNHSYIEIPAPAMHLVFSADAETRPLLPSDQWDLLNMTTGRLTSTIAQIDSLRQFWLQQYNHSQGKIIAMNRYLGDLHTKYGAMYMQESKNKILTEMELLSRYSITIQCVRDHVLSMGKHLTKLREYAESVLKHREATKATVQKYQYILKPAYITVFPGHARLSEEEQLEEYMSDCILMKSLPVTACQVMFGAIKITLLREIYAKPTYTTDRFMLSANTITDRHGNPAVMGPFEFYHHNSSK